MGRARTPLGCHGEIHYRTLTTGSVQARSRLRDLDGVTREVSATATSKSAAHNMLLEIIKERLDTWAGHGSLITPTSTIEELAALWLAEVETKNLSTGTLRVYRSTVDLYVLKYMRGWMLREVTTGRVDRVLKQHIAKGLRSETLRKVLHQIFALAIRHDAMIANPVTNVARVRKHNEPVRTLENASQISDIRALVHRWETKERPGPKAGRDMRDLVTLLLSTGVRIGEALGVRWSDVNLAAEQPYVLVTGTVKQEKGLGIYRKDTPKTPGSIRRLELPPTAVAMLMDRQLAQGDHTSIDAVFPSRVGTWQSVSGMERRWRSLTYQTPYEWVTFKTFRKTVATRIAQQLDSKAAARQLGHASDKITETYYIPRSETGPQVAALLDEVLRSSDPTA